MQECLKNDKTLITDYNGKVNYQVNNANKLGFVVVTDNKVRARGASATADRGGDAAAQPDQMGHALSDAAGAAHVDCV